METNKKGLKSEEDKTSDSKDQLEKKVTSPEEGGDEKKPADDEVSISKSELEQLRKATIERDNYRKAVIRLNRLKGRSLPQSEPERKPKTEDDFEEPTKEEFVTKSELLRRDEKSAINKACENTEIDENWDEIIVYYNPPIENSYDAKLTAITRAHRLWALDNREVKESEEKLKAESEKITRELATEKGLSKGKEKQPIIPKKSIIPKKAKMEEWY